MVPLPPWLRMLAFQCGYQHAAGKVFWPSHLEPRSLIRLLQSFESLDSRSVAVVIDPIQSVKGKVVIDAFRLIQPQTVVAGSDTCVMTEMSLAFIA